MTTGGQGLPHITEVLAADGWHCQTSCNGINREEESKMKITAVDEPSFFPSAPGRQPEVGMNFIYCSADDVTVLRASDGQLSIILELKTKNNVTGLYL